MERTLVLVKPDGVQRGLIGAVLSRLEQRGLKIAALKMLWLNETLARQHYAPLADQPFFPGLIRFITSGPLVAAVIEGPRAIELVRQTMGVTDPAQAAPGTIRSDFGLDIGRNIVHGSDSPASAEREIALFFRPAELLSYEREVDRWIVEER